jgi:molybdopterin-guanine dinucleotide biosynthesis adapter protein
VRKPYTKKLPKLGSTSQIMLLGNSKPYGAVLGVAGWSGSGKTTLIEKLIPLLVRAGLRVSTLKHAHHQAELDTPGKDSWRHRQAGAQDVLLVTSNRWALMHELRDEPEPELGTLLARLSRCDLVLVEGFKRDPIDKIEIHREPVGKPWLYPEDDHILAVISDVPPPDKLRHFGLDDMESIAAFIRTSVVRR